MTACCWCAALPVIAIGIWATISSIVGENDPGCLVVHPPVFSWPVTTLHTPGT
jgi:hypothetical protein